MCVSIRSTAAVPAPKTAGLRSAATSRRWSFAARCGSLVIRSMLRRAPARALTAVRLWHSFPAARDVDLRQRPLVGHGATLWTARDAGRSARAAIGARHHEDDAPADARPQAQAPGGAQAPARRGEGGAHPMG